jgi:hypothetical protein
MSSNVYRFESESAQSEVSLSQTAENILNAATYFVRGVRFYELTDRRNPKPLFAVTFAHHTARRYFEEMFECLLERSGLRAEIVTSIEDESPRRFQLAAANADDFEQHRAAKGEHHPMPPSVKEWAAANSK